VQPTAKPAGVGVVLKPRHAAGELPQHLLDDVGGIGILQAPPPGIAVHQRGVDLDELTPGSRVGQVADPQQQTRAGSGGWHGDLFNNA